MSSGLRQPIRRFSLSHTGINRLLSWYFSRADVQNLKLSDLLGARDRMLKKNKV